MARYKLILAYDGTQFYGSQRQKNRRTVQGELEVALHRLGWTERSVILAGRTDTGVHASGQVATCDMQWNHPVEELQRALNSQLPADLSVTGVSLVEEGFHPRFDALARTYVYRLFIRPIRDPLMERYAWRVWPGISEEILRQASAELLGTHDFSAFGSATTPKGTTIRTVKLSEWKMLEGEWQFEVQADAFLYRMVRRMVFVQVLAAQSRCSVEDIRNAIKDQRELPAGLAPACGLTLVEVTYGSTN
jgi:tRNA pseudouridine38-40 synthase